MAGRSTNTSEESTTGENEECKAINPRTFYYELSSMNHELGAKKNLLTIR
jgi:hypothetical protein